jgi:hypothetical protein
MTDTTEKDAPIPHREFGRCAVCGRDIARWEGMWEDAGGWWHLDGDFPIDHAARVTSPGEGNDG